MRHRQQKGKLARTSEHRKALLANMATSLLIHEQITTTVPKAKVLRPFVEKLITLGKRGELSHRRQAARKLRNHQPAVQKLFSSLAERCKDRQGGYLRIIANGFRYGDAADLAVIEFVDRDKAAKGAADKLRHQQQQQSEKADSSAPLIG